MFPIRGETMSSSIRRHAEASDAPGALNRATALRFAWVARLDDDHADTAATREVLEALGIIAPGGRTILPDEAGPMSLEGPGYDDGANQIAKRPRWVEPPRRASTAPPGLYADPPPPPVQKAAPVKANKPRPAPKPKAERVPREGSNNPFGRPPLPIEHGEEKGYRAHLRRGIPIPEDDPCGCRRAGNAAAQIRQTRQRETRKRDRS
jgi:hypothetical protein